MWSKTILKSLIVPGGILFFGVVLFIQSGWLTLPLPALRFLYYCALAGGMLLALRFHSSRTFFSLVVLFLARQAMTLLGSPHQGALGLTGPQAVAVLVPLNFVLIALTHERGFTLSGTVPIALLLFVQCVIVAVLGNAVEALPLSPARPHHGPAISLPDYVPVVFAAAGIFLLVRFFITRKPIDSALLWSLSAFFLSLCFLGTARVQIVYSATAACILALSIIENSYLLAYHDELTGLPSRRAFNDALSRLQMSYSIAVVDIDHFKRFNDTYGHNTGDEVLRLVATNLSRVTGGGRAFRCGGEEFAILFPGKDTQDAVDHLERLRVLIESSEFRIRSGDRRQVPRGPDRRNQRPRGRTRKGHAIRQLAQEKSADPLSVTVSIGVATGAKEKSDPDDVLQAADRALYRAKANGRNRVETAASGRRRTRARAEEIA